MEFSIQSSKLEINYCDTLENDYCDTLEIMEFLYVEQLISKQVNALFKLNSSILFRSRINCEIIYSEVQSTSTNIPKGKNTLGSF